MGEQRRLGRKLADFVIMCVQQNIPMTARVSYAPEQLPTEHGLTLDDLQRAAAAIRVLSSAQQSAAATLLWLDDEQRHPARWTREESGVNKFALTLAELNRIRTVLAALTAAEIAHAD